jgi:competence protein ComEC
MIAKDNNANHIKRYMLARHIVLVVFGLVLLFTLVWRNDIDHALGLRPQEGALGVYRHGGLGVHYGDVGQGAADVVPLPDGRTMLIDSGPASSQHTLVQYIQRNVQAQHLDIIILTHAHEDHVGGVLAVLDIFGVHADSVIYRPNTKAVNTQDTFVDPGQQYLRGYYTTHNTASYRAAMQAIHSTQAQVIVHYTDMLLITSRSQVSSQQYTFSIMPFGDRQIAGNNLNNKSPIMLLEHMGKRFLFGGDAERATEQAFVQMYATVFGADWYVHVLMLGHHGSNTSTTQVYIDFVTSPATIADTLVVISCARYNQFGHPSPNTINRLLDSGVQSANILRTDTLSHIALAVTNAGIQRLQYQPVGNTRPYGLWWHEIVILSILMLAISLYLPIVYSTKRLTSPS